MIRTFLASFGLSFAVAAPAQPPLAPSAPVAAPAAALPPAAPAARRDPTDPRMRDMPMRCKPGDVDAARGRTLGQIFGAEWPAAPAVPAARRSAAQPLRLGRVEWPASGGTATAVSAVLVDAKGAPLRVQVLCASKAELVAPVERAAMQGTYRAATFDGAPATSVAIVAWRVGTPGRAP
jgi:hypothetical protein